MRPVQTDARAAERALALGYAPPEARAGLAALLAFDDTLGGLIRTARTPMLGQLRLAWWRDALAALDTRAPPANPVLQALAGEVIPRVGGAALLPLVDGWEALLDEPADFGNHASARGAGLFGAAAELLEERSDGLLAAGCGWALADVAAHWSDPVAAATPRALAEGAFAKAFRTAWPLRTRALGALALIARADLRGVLPGAPSRVARLAWHRLTGR